MRKTILSAVVMTGILFTTNANASITGSLSDWGVQAVVNHFSGTGTDYLDLRPNGVGSVGYNPSHPSSGTNSGISYSIWDGYGSHGNSSVGSNGNLKDFGGQNFDVKAIYASSDGTNLYTGIVTGFNPGGTADPYGRSITYAPGDIAINPTTNGAQYGVLLPTSAPGSSGAANLSMGGTWNIPNAAQGFPGGDLVKYDSGGSVMSNAAFYRYDQILVNGMPVTYSDPVTGTNVPLYLIEASVPLSVINASAGSDLTLRWGMSCANDTLSVSHTVVPEPAMTGAISAGIASLVLRLRRRK